jgi:predicted Zn-dependent protease
VSVLGLVGALLSSCAVDPITGDEQLMLFAPDKDVELGRRYSPLVEKELGGRMPEPGLQSYINQIGQRIAGFCQRPDLSYHSSIKPRPLAVRPEELRSDPACTKT